MTPEPRKTRSRIDADGVKVTQVAGVRTGVWLIALALLLVGLAGLLALRVALPDEDSELEAGAPAPPVPAVGSALAAPATAAAAAPVDEARRGHPVRRKPTPPPPLPPGSTEVPRAEPPSLPEVSDDAGGGGPSGIALFPPPGTDPPKVGLLVPEDFPLPEGYVRHYQSTDDGEPLPAILMFHPDFVWLDENGNQIPLPPDLVVPPEMAPPGMPKVPIEIPAPRPEPDQAVAPATPSPEPAP